MQWSITVGRIAGTAIRIHLTFLIFLLWIGISDYLVGGLPAAWSAILFIVLIFVCVVAHEFGHILTARGFGVKTPDVTLLPIGGVANMERIPDDPRQELVIAIAGPMVNVAIATILIVVGGFSIAGLASAGLETAPLVQRLAFVNIALVVFNLVPAFPMDGGRVLRALLSMRLGPQRSTAIAAKLGQAFAFLFVLAGLFVNPMLIFVGMFIYVAAVSEQQASAFRGLTHDLKVHHGMEKGVRSLAANALLPDAVEALLATAQRVFPVVDEQNHPVGLLDREDMLHSLKQKDTGIAVSSIMRTPPVIQENSSLETAVMEMNQQGLRSQIVVDEGGRLSGLLTFENIAEMMMIKTADPQWKFAGSPRR